MRTRFTRRAIFVFVIVAAIGSAFVAASCGNKRSSRKGIPATVDGAPRRRELTPLPVRPLSPALEGVRRRVMPAVAATRELAWQRDAGMSELSGWEYGTRAKELADILAGDELRALSRLAVAGGMLPEGTDLATLAASFTAASAGATYSPLDKRVLILAGQGADAPHAHDESLITHEYVHALQDQHFDLLKLLAVRPYNFDRAEAAFAVVEGDAMNVQRRREQTDAVWSRRTLEEIGRNEDARFGDYRREIGAFFPPLLTETFIFRYRDGARFVEAVRRKSGARGVDELLRRPPASSEQVLHPEKYFAGESPREVTLDEEQFAANNWKAAATTPLGELGVRGLLLKSLTATEATRAAAGWGGDRAYLFERAKSTPLFVWKTRWDTPGEAAEFFRAYNVLRGKIGEQRDGASDPSQFIWRNGALFTLVRLEGDQVIVIRGAEADARGALEFALR